MMSLLERSASCVSAQIATRHGLAAGVVRITAAPSVAALLEGSGERQVSNMEASAGCPPSVSTKLMICLDEIASHVMKFSKASKLTVRLEHGAPPGTWRLSFADDGTPWDPLTHADPDITLSAEERPIGGLGLLMVKKMMDEVSYAREDRQNVLRLRIAKKQ